jgi:uroporphyrinogen-III synthase
MTQAPGSPVLVTRPARAGERLTEHLRGRGFNAVWWPAFEITGTADENRTRAALAGLADYDLALFVSSNAVHAVAARLSAEWPPATAIGVVGEATRETVLAELHGAAFAPLIAPADDDAGSEGLWRAWLQSGRRARRVLLLRAEQGRDWIVEQFRAAGAEIDAVAVYRRCVHQPDAAAFEQMSRWISAGIAPTVVFSSSEAVGALDGQVVAVAGAQSWLRSGRALATHPRVAEQLREANYADVATCSADDDAVTGKLESMRR